MKCLVYGGTLAHYTGDAAMPLHTTRDFDGRNQPDGTVKQKGIHAKIDGFPEKNKITPEEVCRGLEAKKIDDVWEHVNEVHRGVAHARREVLRVRRGRGVRQADGGEPGVHPGPRAGRAQLTLDLWYTAWLRSEKLPAHW